MSAVTVPANRKPRVVPKPPRRRARSGAASLTRHVLETLRKYESRNVTFIEADGSWPIVWERARGVQVWDAAGREYLDLTAAFGVAAAGHANPRVVRAGQRQMARLLHAMGDVHPHALKAELARELSRLTFERWSAAGTNARRAPMTGKVLFGSSGFEAVEAALKTALLVTAKPGVIAFEGAYHGLGYGALNATHRTHFRSPFRRQLREFADFAPFPEDEAGLERTDATLRRLFHRQRIGAVLVEPVQARGGIRIPPAGFLPRLRQLCTEHDALLVLDEIYTGFGRTGRWFASEHSGVVPDLVCLGKALAGGFPLSGCIGRANLMDAGWPEATGEAIHTSTFLGHPVGCAMALAQLRELAARNLIERSAARGATLLRHLQSIRLASAAGQVEARGTGLMAGLELRHADGKPATDLALATVKGLLRKGFILLPEGEHSNVISLTPPLTITPPQLARAIDALAATLRELTS